MVRLHQIVETLETLYPLSYAEQWDHPGLIVGDLDREVRRVAFAVDPTMEAIDQGLDWQADMLVCHHPLLFQAVHSVSGSDAQGAKVSKLYQRHCALWVGHTNADVAYRGVGQAAADAFGLIDQRPLVPMQGQESGQQLGLGRVGLLPEAMPLENFARLVSRALPQTHLGIQVAGDLYGMVSRVAVLPGSGDSLFDQVRSSGADVYVTSDLRHHPATDALEEARLQAHVKAAGLGMATSETNRSQIRPALINTPHSAIESLWFNYAPEDLSQTVKSATGEEIECRSLAVNTDPWNLTIGWNQE